MVNDEKEDGSGESSTSKITAQEVDVDEDESQGHFLICSFLLSVYSTQLLQLW